ncbi:BRCA1-associated protein [Actinidia chinensis var. chinensis]|uniref:BRCA1-associated protein n=1 Tax=Actinidia chinensis var. chinensis TaxID=1590841 RepID=A0A2R6RBX5_ACTCC|nr:BRCA1-associated protein [Actinidia chinensis var. chinensis]
MGSAFCVAAKDKTVTNGSPSEGLTRNVRCSPSRSLRQDNRGRVAGEETSVNSVSDGVSWHNGLEIKSETTVDTVNAVDERNAGILRLPSPDLSNTRNVPTEMESIESPAVPDSSPVKLSPSVHSSSSLSPSPFASRSHNLHASSTPSRWPHHSPGNKLLRQISDSRIAGHNSPNLPISEGTPFMFPGLSIGSPKGSNDRSSDGWYMPAFPEFMPTSHGERWSFDSESSFGYEKMGRSSSQLSASPSTDMQTCGVCLKLLADTYELAVVAVLICGHAFHAECLENVTPEINMNDPACPICTLGEKQTLKLSGRSLKTGTDLKSRRKRSKNRIVNSELDGDSLVFDGQKCSGLEGKSPKMISSSSMKKSSLGKHFLRRYFSFGSKGTTSLLETHATRKKGHFWSKSGKE